MRRLFTATFMTVALSAAPALARTPVSVTRFSLDATVVRGTVAVAGGAPSLESRADEDAVARTLAQAGFAAADAGSARYLYTVEVAHDLRPSIQRRSPVTIGIGGGTGGYGGGVGLGASFGIGRHPPQDIVTARLFVRLRDRVTQQVVWEGRAEATGAPRDTETGRLASALFRDFPGASGRTITVR